MKTLYAYKVKPIAGGQFFAAVVRDDLDKLITMSSRNGRWQQDAKLNFYDLMTPHYTLHEWDIEAIDPKDLPTIEGMENTDAQPDL